MIHYLALQYGHYLPSLIHVQVRYVEHHLLQPRILGIYDLVEKKEDEQRDCALDADRVTQAALESFGEGFRLELRRQCCGFDLP